MGATFNLSCTPCCDAVDTGTGPFCEPCRRGMPSSMQVSISGVVEGDAGCEEFFDGCDTWNRTWTLPRTGPCRYFSGEPDPCGEHEGAISVEFFQADIDNKVKVRCTLEDIDVDSARFIKYIDADENGQIDCRSVGELFIDFVDTDLCDATDAVCIAL